ncbi:unnamed protein product [Durusdinium trenchii]|uniref:Phosphatidylcholine translocator ABCB4 (ATP-binding cassette sub-family B member 4) (Multidrug resistance protein 3) (P-glycoprotein 3) n=2 Tax=Durusdinium trenchii TaxID=1381693 RepID=A0ABP0PPU2_9DINO
MASMASVSWAPPLALAPALLLVQRWRLWLRKLRAKAVAVWPTWPPPPELLLRKGFAVSLLAALLLLLWVARSPGKNFLEDEEMLAWVRKEQEKRRSKLEDLLQQIPVSRLAQQVPPLRPFLTSGGLPVNDREAEEAAKEAVVVAAKFQITANSVSEAAEDLAKAQPGAALAAEGLACAAALAALELKSAPEEALQQRVAEAEEFTMLVQSRLSRGRARDVWRLYAEPLASAERILRQRRLEQWRCVARLLWRFKTTLPFVALSSVLSMVLGAFSAMRYHYQASVINLAKEAVTSSSGPARAKHGMQEAIGAMVVSEMILQLAEFARGRLTLRGKTKVVQELKVALFGALLRQDLEYLEQCDLWQLRSLIGSCGTTISQVVDFPATLLEAAVRLFTAVLALGRQNGRLAAFLGVMLPARFLLSQALQHCEERLEQSALPDFKGQINSCWSCLVQPASLRTMRAFAREPHELKTFTRFLQVHEELQQRKILIFRLMQPLQALLEHALEIGTLWYGGRLALRGDMDFGELSSAVLVATGAFDGARFAQAAAANVSRQALGPLAQMAQLLARRPRIGLDHSPWSSMPKPEDVRWTLDFQEVTFSYQQRGVEVLKGLSFQVREGEFLGILGTTGSGKSTVLSLMLRLYEPTSGRILLDGREIKDYNPLWLRYHIGFVSQDLVLCNRTVRENLLYGVAEAAEVVGDAAAKEALRVAQCEETFFNTEAFPNLWHTDVGVGGSDLSGGEKQRLAVARAIVKKPKLLILDEATSALDEISQARLQDEIEKLRKEEGMTVICVAHRLSNLARADRLLVLQEGRLVEEGSPAELHQRDGVFAEYARAHQAFLQDPS